jgi:hypothetical protein
MQWRSSEMPSQAELRRQAVETLNRLIDRKRNDPNWEKWPDGTSSDARRSVYREILEGFDTIAEAREYVEGMPEDNVIFTARGDEISFLLIRLIIADIEKNPWLSHFRRPKSVKASSRRFCHSSSDVPGAVSTWERKSRTRTSP